MQQKTAAKHFAEYWNGKGYEKGESQKFWLALLGDVFGVEHAGEYISFEDQVHLDHTSFIDGYIPETHVLIEQKGIGKDLKKPIKQSDGTLLKPIEQAKRYANELPYSQRPRWIIVCNFECFHIYDMEHPQADPIELWLKDLPTQYYLLEFLVRKEDITLQQEMEISIQAGELVGKLYDAFLKEYKDPTNEHSLQSLNALCVRLVFCLYAEDAGIFGKRLMFHDYMLRNGLSKARQALIDLFHVLDTPIEDRDPYMDDELAAFPYVNGGLFSDENIEIPRFNPEIYDLLLNKASAAFDWSEISPTIFGAVFESTLNPETRRKGGMHYTSIENIHKVIDPLFLNDLKAELEQIKQSSNAGGARTKKMQAFQRKLASLTFFDPACGSGNFLTETYLSIRRLENEVIRYLKGQAEGQIMFDFIGNESIGVMVSIKQFYGIEINDFAVSVAKTALWIAEAQMLRETKNTADIDDEFLPLTTIANIHEGNALRIDWNDVVPAQQLSFCMGNPPFIGLSLRNTEQQEDMAIVFSDNDRAGRLDYVAAWYKKAAQYIVGTSIQVAFVSTNSIVQGEQVPILWGDLFITHGIIINFAYRTFVWNSEAKEKAAVHCVIIGFALFSRDRKTIFENGTMRYVNHINGYLVDADNVFIQLRGKAQSGFPRLVQGNKPWDGGYLILSEDERAALIIKYPNADMLIREYIGSYEFINRKKRYCLWLQGIAPSAYRNIPEIIQRLQGVAETRRKTKTVAVQAQADTPMLFSQIRQPDDDYILIPETSSGGRRYIPMGFMRKEVIASNSTLVTTGATLFMFGVLTSNVHMAWVRTICGRLKSDYRYSPSIYNNFPWPDATPAQKTRIEQTAQAILDARALYPQSSLADLYDELTMPPELRKAHQANDRAVMEAYGMPIKGTTESSCVAELMRRYQAMTAAETK